MTDRELLKLAAKAAGIPHKWNQFWNGFYVQNFDKANGETWDAGSLWNPLTDDGDALRLLAVMPSLWSLKLMFGTPSIVMDVARGTGKGIVVSRRSSQYEDRSEAIRRAIVMAMAEIALEKAKATK